MFRLSYRLSGLRLRTTRWDSLPDYKKEVKPMFTGSLPRPPGHSRVRRRTWVSCVAVGTTGPFPSRTRPFQWTPGTLGTGRRGKDRGRNTTDTDPLPINTYSHLRTFENRCEIGPSTLSSDREYRDSFPISKIVCVRSVTFVLTYLSACE